MGIPDCSTMPSDIDTVSSKDSHRFGSMRVIPDGTDQGNVRAEDRGMTSKVRRRSAELLAIREQVP